MTRYFILKNGSPDYMNALELPCTERKLAEIEVERLRALQMERLKKAEAWTYTGRGSAFTAPSREINTFEVGSLEV